MFQSMHPSYYHQAHACIMVFDATRKVTYKNLATWYQELREHRPHIPVLCAANKIDSKSGSLEHCSCTTLSGLSQTETTVTTHPIFTFGRLLVGTQSEEKLLRTKRKEIYTINTIKI